MKSIVVVGSLNADMVLQTERQPRPGETLHAQSFAMNTGGKGANQAATVGRLGGTVVMIGCVGSDALAAPILQDLASAGVDSSLITRTTGPTGVAVITVTPSGENTILLSAGANAELHPQHLEAHRERIALASIVLTQLETPLATVDALAVLCEQTGTPLMLDPAPAQRLSPATLRRLTWLTPNETESAVLFGRSIEQASDEELKTLADEVLGSGPSNLLLKLGSRGAYLATSEGLRERIASYPVQAVDTTAAGDCFNGAFALRLTAGDDAGSAARYAAAAAAISVTRRGALPSLPTAQDVDHFLATM